jgi:DNA-binding transcriptional ArsR family regulator
MTPERFSGRELSALAVVTAECGQRGACALTLDAIAALAEVSRTTVRNALRKARGLGLVEVEERRQFAAPNLASVVKLAREQACSNSQKPLDPGRGASPLRRSRNIVEHGAKLRGALRRKRRAAPSRAARASS